MKRLPFATDAVSTTFIKFKRVYQLFWMAVLAAVERPKDLLRCTIVTGKSYLISIFHNGIILVHISNCSWPVPSCSESVYRRWPFASCQGGSRSCPLLFTEYHQDTHTHQSDFSLPCSSKGHRRFHQRKASDFHLNRTYKGKASMHWNRVIEFQYEASSCDGSRLDIVC